MVGDRADVATKPRPRRGFVVFKWLVYGLLALNVGLYGWHGTANEQLDTAAWVVLLLLFEWETGGWRVAARGRRLVHALRLAAGAAIVWTCIAYARERAWLDFANALAWLGVVVALELEVRVPVAARRLHRGRLMVLGLLYATLFALLLAWLAIGMREADDAGAWLDAWDALLWLVAFVVIELNVFGAAAPRGAASYPPPRS